MSIMICSECQNSFDTDIDDFDFETETCRRCVESKQFIEREQKCLKK
jgi:hypothetical protein